MLFCGSLLFQRTARSLRSGPSWPPRGLGGSTASLFPRTQRLAVTNPIAVGCKRPACVVPQRLTVTRPTPVRYVSSLEDAAGNSHVRQRVEGVEKRPASVQDAAHRRAGSWSLDQVWLGPPRADASGYGLPALGACKNNRYTHTLLGARLTRILIPTDKVDCYRCWRQQWRPAPRPLS
jgi:hypothetical protein